MTTTATEGREVGRAAALASPWALGVGHAAKGEGGPPLLLLHGFLGTPGAWDAVLAALPRHGPVWCPWLPGHGPAPPGPPTWDEAAQALADSLPAGAVLAGYSLGGRLALAAALRRPGRVRATHLVGGHVGLADDSERAERIALDAGRAAALRSGDLPAFVAAWEALPLFASQRALPEALASKQRAGRTAHDPQALAWSFDVAGLARMPDLRPAVAAARQPLRFLTGALDLRFSALAASLARPPWVTHRSVAGAGHNLLLEAPAAVAASLIDFMEMQ
jgi:2-succinyl-6-hydroxy-2,4-cyclohexadiene-1-carboxylate synthase